ncbi:MAG: ATP-dependent Clp protease adaptor ClpS [Cyclobacteriaceae bacterium]|nr:ATP-dependent Clp protease adaptor ClpS [Cyclobacteriaceae bacterium]
MQELELPELELDERIVEPNVLVVFNDDVNSFDHVINTLIKVCKHTSEQAEQCTFLIHYKGKCAVKMGERGELKPMAQAICEVGIDARIQ